MVQVNYAAANLCIHGSTKALAKRRGRGITVNAVAPVMSTPRWCGRCRPKSSKDHRAHP